MSRVAARLVVRLVAAIALGLALALVIDVIRLGGPERWLLAHRWPPPYVASGTTVDVDGAAMYLDCRGAGGPTVLLDSGLGTSVAGWGFVLDRVAEFTRVCGWDRPGIGGSEAVGRHTAVETAERVRAALATGGEQGPFVYVGHSLGGVYARIFGARYHDEMAGVVLVDPYLPDIRVVEDIDLDPALRREWLAAIASTNESIAAVEQLDWPATERELEAADLGDVPLELLFVDQRLRWVGPYEPWQDELIAAWEEAVLALSSDSRLTIAVNSTHMIQWDRPDLVVAAIDRLVDAGRGGQPAAEGRMFWLRWKTLAGS